jgi:3-dehydroquinate synthase
MVMAAELSAVDPAVSNRLKILIERAGLPTAAPNIGSAKMLDAMSRDKKVQQKEIRFVLLRELGDAFITADVDTDRLKELCEAGG